MNYFAIKNQLNNLPVELDGNKIQLAWTLPTQNGKGFLSSNDSFSISKRTGKLPVDVARDLAVQLEANKSKHSQLKNVDFKAEGPFINVYLSNEGLIELLKSPQKLSALPQDERVMMFEYIGANVAKRLHIGHMRNLNIGEALRRVLSLRYPNIITDNHWGDWGVQFGILLWAYKQELNQAGFEADPMGELQRLYVWGNAQQDEVDNWATIVRDEFKLLESGDEENVRLWTMFLKVSKQELQRDLELLNVPKTDIEQGESYYEPWMQKLTDFCDKYNLWQVDGLARYVDFKSLNLDKWNQLSEEQKQHISKLGRAYFVSSQGYTTYVFRDVAARLQWADEHNVDLAVTLTDNRQQHNFNQAFAFTAYLAQTEQFKQKWGSDIAKRLNLNNLRHVGYGRLSLTTGSLSSRSGGGLSLREGYKTVYDSVESEFIQRGLDVTEKKLSAMTAAALKWNDLKTDPNTDIVIDPEDIVSFEGDTGVYQLYTNVRLKGILRKHSVDADVYSKSELDPEIINEAERDLMEQLIKLNEHIYQATEHFNVSPFVVAVGALNRDINKWYEQHRVSEADKERKLVMLSIVETLQKAIKTSLELLGIEPIDKL